MLYIVNKNVKNKNVQWRLELLGCWISYVKCQTVSLPTDACKNLSPILVSLPIAFETSETSAPVASHTALSALILEILWARKALAACKHIEKLQLRFA